jgi:transposase
MPMKYNIDVRKFVLQLVQKKKQSIKSVVEFTGISMSTVRRWIKHGVKDKPIQRKLVCLRQQLAPHVSQFLKIKGSWTYKMIIEELKKYNLSCCKRTLYRILQDLNMSRKRMKKKRLSKNATPQTIQSFKDKFNEILNDGEDIIFQDESHYSNDILPLYGYSEKNVPCYIAAATERSAFTLNFAFSKSGQIFYKIYKGSSCESRMQWFVDHLPRVRILFDNHSTHKCINADVERIYTPVAHPDANPVECVFSKIKEAFRYINDNNRDLDVETKLEMAIETLVLEDLEHAIEYTRDYLQTLLVQNGNDDS